MLKQQQQSRWRTQFWNWVKISILWPLISEYLGSRKPQVPVQVAVQAWPLQAVPHLSWLEIWHTMVLVCQCSVSKFILVATYTCLQVQRSPAPSHLWFQLWWRGPRGPRRPARHSQWTPGCHWQHCRQHLRGGQSQPWRGEWSWSSSLLNGLLLLVALRELRLIMKTNFLSILFAFTGASSRWKWQLTNSSFQRFLEANITSNSGFHRMSDILTQYLGQIQSHIVVWLLTFDYFLFVKFD